MSNGRVHVEEVGVARQPKEIDREMVASARQQARPLSAVERNELNTLTLPRTRDYAPFVTLVYDQVGGGCGGATTIGIANVLKELECPYTPDLSLRFLHYVFNDSSSLHRDPRITRHGLDQSGVMVYYGCCSESTWPSVVNAYPDTDIPPDSAFQEARHLRLDLMDATSPNPGCSDPIESPDPTTIKQLLFKHGPLVAYSDVHVFALIGYDDDQGVFTILNSWGSNWHVNGVVSVPYEKISNPFGDDHTFDVKRVRYLRNAAGTVGPRFTGRIRIRHDGGRGNLTVKVSAEGHPALVAWAPREADNSRSLSLDFPLPPYAAQFWPPKENRRWLLEVSDRSTGAAGVAAVVEEVTLVERIRVAQGRWMPVLYRPSVGRFDVPRGGTVTVYVPTRRSYLVQLNAEPPEVASNGSVTITGRLFTQLNASSTRTVLVPLTEQRIFVNRVKHDPIEGTVTETVVGECRTDNDGGYTLVDRPQSSADYQSVAVRPDHSVIAVSQVRHVSVA